MQRLRSTGRLSLLFLIPTRSKMVLGSDVPLEEDILRRPTPFSQSWVEWSAENRTQVFERASTTTASVIVFTVPEGSDFFLTGVWMSIISTSANSGARNDMLWFRPGTINFMSVGAGIRSANSIFVNFSMPLRLRAGDSLRILSNDAAATAEAFVTGFLQPILQAGNKF